MLPSWLRSLRTPSRKRLRRSNISRPRGFGPMVERLEDRWVLSTFQVTSTSDDGSPGSLRWAILQANSNPGADAITFNLPGPGVQTINVVGSALPTVTGPTTIDGESQPGYAGRPLIVVSGAGAGQSAVGLTITGGPTTVQGLVINQFGGDGIDLTGGSTTLQANYIGTAADGVTALPNGGYGVNISGSSGNQIGGASSLKHPTGVLGGAGNLISGNQAGGILVENSANNIIQGNYISTDATGTHSLNNGLGVNFAGDSIDLQDGATNTLVGGVSSIDPFGNLIGLGNLLSGGGGDGIFMAEITGSNNPVSNTVIQGNFIGVDVTGAHALGNSYVGIHIEGLTSDTQIGGTTPGTGNVISANGTFGLANYQQGIKIQSPSRGGLVTGTVIQGNFIGTDASGTHPLGNLGDGVQIIGDSNFALNNPLIGGTSVGAGNVIAGNQGTGVEIDNAGVSGSQIQGNFIGTTSAQVSTVTDGLASTEGNTSISLGANGAYHYQQEVAASDFSGPVLITSISVRLDASAAASISGNYADLLVQLSTTSQALGGLSTTYASNVGSDVKTVFSGPVTFSLLASGNGNGPNVFGATVTLTTPFLYNPAAGNLLYDAQTSGGPSVAYRLDAQTLTGTWAITGTPGAATASQAYSGITVLQFTSTPANLGNAGSGIIISGGSTTNVIGGPTSTPGTGAGNVIAGNGQNGILLSGGGTNVVQGNLIGTNAAGNAALSNGTAQAGGLFGGNDEGIHIDNSSNNIIGGTSAADRNIVSGSVVDGIQITGTAASGNVIQGNFVGTDITGTVRLGNAYSGISIFSNASGNIVGGTQGGSPGGSLTGAGNLISGNSGGVYLASGANSNVVQGNYIGTDVTGTLALGNPNFGVYASSASNLIGGNVAGAGNLVSGNGYGVQLDLTSATGNLVQGNKIGTNAGGNAALGNTSTGVLVSGGAQNNLIGVNGADANAALEGNVISANGFLGIEVIGASTSGTVIAGNEIGTNAAGTAPLGNVSGGIQVFGAPNTRIGTNADGVGDALERNIISANSGEGIYANAETPVTSLSIVNQLISGTLQRTTATGTVAQADFKDQQAGLSGHWTFDNPIPGGGGTDYALVATGTLQVNTAGSFSFNHASDDGGELLIDGSPVIVDDALQSFADKFATITLTAGTHSLEWIGFQHLGNAEFELSVAVGAGNTGPVTAANGWHVLGDPSPAAQISLAGPLSVTVYYAKPVNNVVTIAGNIIGADAAGTHALANTSNGIDIHAAPGAVVGGTAAGAGNVIAFNGGLGVYVNGPPSQSVFVQNNTYLSNTGNAIQLDAGVQAFVSGTVAGNVLDNGTFDLGGINTSIGALSGSGRVTNTIQNPINPGPVTFSVGSTNGSATFSGVIQNAVGTLNLTKTGTGTQTLIGLNTYTGTTTINAGGALQLGFGNATASLGGGNVVDNGTLTFNLSNDFTVANSISGSGGLTQAGVGTLTLTGANTYFGTTSIATGTTLLAGSASALSAHSSFSNAGTLNLGGFSNSVGALNGNGKVTNSLVHVYQIDDGVLRNTAGTVFGFNNSLTGEAEDNWIGNVFTAMAGATQLNSVSFATFTALSSANLPSPFVTAALYLGSPATGLTLIPGSVNTVPLNAASLQMVTVPFAVPQTLTSGQVFTAALLIDDVPTNVFPFISTAIGTNTNSYYDVSSPPGNVNTYNLATPNAPTLHGVNYPGVNGTDANANIALLRVNATATLPFGGTPAATLTVTGGGAFSGVIQDGAGAVALIKSGSNTLALSGLNTYSGGTTISGGTLVVTGTLGSGSVGVAVNAVLNDVDNGVGDSGPGSLRQAILNANAASGAGLNEITFNISGSGVKVIQPVSALPAINSSVLVDGTSQPGYVGTPLIELNGLNAGSGASGLTLAASNITVLGLDINQFNGDGIDVTGGHDVIQQSYVGVDPSGTIALGNAGAGINISNSSNNQISGNIISANLGAGIEVAGGNATGNNVQGNIVGTNPGVTNAGEIPGALAWFKGEGDASSSTGQNNGALVGGATFALGKVGQAFSLNGSGQYVVAPPSATLTPLTGVTVEAWIDPATLPSANSPTGGWDVFNELFDRGSELNGAGAYALRLLFNGSLQFLVGTSAHNGYQTVTTAPGTVAPGVFTHVAGTYDSATGQLSVYVNGVATTTTASGTLNQDRHQLKIGADLFNFTYFQGLIDEPTVYARALSSSEIGHIVALAQQGKPVSLGNAYGIRIENGANNNTIGGTGQGGANFIAFSTFAGVAVVGPTSAGNSIRGNSIYGNSGLGINLAGTGNNNQSVPVVIAAAVDPIAPSTEIKGTFTGAPNTTYQLDFYDNGITVDPSGFGQGQTYLGTATIITDGNGQPTPGSSTFFAHINSALPVGDVLTITATDASGNTSQFSNDVVTFLRATVSVSGLGLAVRGQRLTYNINTSADATDLAAGLQYKVDFGDGSLLQTITSTATSLVTSGHLFVEARPLAYTVTVTVQDRFGFTSQQTTQTLIQVFALEANNTELDVGAQLGGSTFLLTGILDPAHPANDTFNLNLDAGTSSAVTINHLDPEFTPQILAALSKFVLWGQQTTGNGTNSFDAGGYTGTVDIHNGVGNNSVVGSQTGVNNFNYDAHANDSLVIVAPATATNNLSFAGSDQAVTFDLGQLSGQVQQVTATGDMLAVEGSTFGVAAKLNTFSTSNFNDTLLIPSGFAANQTFNVHGGAGNDTFTITSPLSGANDTFTIDNTSFVSGSGSDTFTIGNIDASGHVVGVTGNDTFTINNSSFSGNDTFTIGSSTTLNDTFTINNSTISGNDTFTINNQNAAGSTAFTINDGSSFIAGANDTFVSINDVGASHDTFTINGGLNFANSANDTFVISAAGTGQDTFTINGGVVAGNNDTFTIGGAGAGANTFMITGGIQAAGNDTFTLQSAGTGNDTFVIGGTVTSNLGGQDTFLVTSGITTGLGGGGNDTFTIGSTGLGNDTFVIGNINAAGNSSDTFTIGSTGLGNDTFTIGSTGSLSAGLIAGSNDTFILTQGGGASDTFTIQNGVDASGALNDTFVINNSGALAGNDTFTINSSFLGGAGNDQFFVQDTGTGASNDTFIINGNINVGAGNDTFVINAGAGLGTSTGNDTFTINGSITATGLGGQDTFTITNQTVGAGGVIGNSAGNDTFVITGGIQATGNDTFTIESAGIGNDTFVIGGTVSTSLGGQDTFTITSGITTGLGNDTFTIGSTGLGNDTFVIGNINAAGSLNDTFTIGSTGLGNDTFIIGAAGSSAGVTLGSGNDTFILTQGGGANDTFTIQGGVSAAGALSDTFVINNAGAVSGNDTFTINSSFTGGAGATQFFVQDTGTGASNDTFIINGNINVGAGAGNDTFVINAGAGVGTSTGNDTFTINGSIAALGTGQDTFTITNQTVGVNGVIGSSAGNDTFVITGGIQATGNDTFTIESAGIGNDTFVIGGTVTTGLGGQDTFTITSGITTGQGNDTFTIGSTGLGNDTFVIGSINAAGSLNDTFTIGSTGLGNDTFIIGAAGSSAGVTLGSGNDTFILTQGGGANDTFTINGGVSAAGSLNDTFVINNAGATTGNDTFTINSSFTGGAGATQFFVQDTGTGASNDTFIINGNINVGAGAGNDTFVINAGAGIGTSTGNDTFTINGAITAMGSGQDTFTITNQTVGVNGVIGSSAGNDTFVITGGIQATGNDTFTIESAGIGNDTFVIGGTVSTGLGGQDTFTITSGITTGLGNDTFTIGSTGLGNDTFVIGNINAAGSLNDTFTIGSTGLGNDTFTIGTAGSATAGVILGSGNDTFILTQGGGASDTFTIQGGVSATGAGNDAFVINNAGAATGSDTFTINSSFAGGTGNNLFFVQDTSTGSSNDTFIINGNLGGAPGSSNAFAITNNSAGNDTFTINGALFGGGVGSAKFEFNNTGSGNDTFTITGGLRDVGTGSDILLLSNTGNGNDNFTISGGVAFGTGDDLFSINTLGNGNNNIAINGNVVLGNADNSFFVISQAGDGNNNIAINGSVTAGNGDGFMTLGTSGAGTDVITITGAVAFGSGTDSLQINGSGAGHATFNLPGGVSGQGFDTYTIEDPGAVAGDESMTVNGNLGGGAGSNTFIVTAGLNYHSGKDTFALNGNLIGGAGSNTFSVTNSGLATNSFTLNGTLQGGSNDQGDVFELAGLYQTVHLKSGSSISAGTGDTYEFSGAVQGTFLIQAPNQPNRTDTLDFSTLNSGVVVNLGSTALQTVAPGLTLQLSDANGFSNVIATAFNDTIYGNARTNLLQGSNSLDSAYNSAAPGVGSNGKLQVVLLDFDTAFNQANGVFNFNTFYATAGVTPLHFYKPMERQAILQTIATDYAPFLAQFDSAGHLTQGGVYFTTNPSDPLLLAAGTNYITEYFDQSVPAGGDEATSPTGAVASPQFEPGGTSSDLDFRDADMTGTASIQVNGILGEPLQPPATETNWITISSKIAAHELGHLLGLHHADSFGPIGDGIMPLPGGANYNPAYTGPEDANETFDHVITSGDSVGADRWNDLRDVFFGEREDVMLAFSFAAPTTPTNPANVSAANPSLFVAQRQSPTKPTTQASAQPLYLASMAVPNTENYGRNAGTTFEVQAIDVQGTIGLSGGLAEQDYYSFTGNAGDVINVNVMSQGITRYANLGPNGYIDPVVFLYKVNANGSLTQVAYNDDVFAASASGDSSLVDVTLPSSGSYVIKVASFSYSQEGALDGVQTPTEAQIQAAAAQITDPTQRAIFLQNAEDAVNGTDTGNYELFVYRFKAGTTTSGADSFTPGTGPATIVGGAANSDVLGNVQAVSFSTVVGDSRNVTLATFAGVSGSGIYAASINWGDGSTSAGSVSIAGGQVSILGSHPYHAPGAYPVSITLTEDAVTVHLTAQATIAKDSTTTTATASPVTPSFGQADTLTANVAANAPGSGTPTGNVDFFDTSTGIDLGSVSLASGAAHLTTSALPLGQNVITITYSGDSNFLSSSTTITVTVGQSIYVLDPKAAGALSLSGNANISVTGNVIVDSNSSSALSASGNAKLTAASIQVVGGVQKLGSATFNPGPVTGVSQAADPLAGLAAPSTAGLINRGAVSVSGSSSQTLSPGIYSSITVSGNATATLSAGIYIIEGGGLSVSGNANLNGTGVLIFNTGSKYPVAGGTYGAITLSGNGAIKLTGPTTGALAGIMIDQDPNDTQALNISGNASGMSGLIYAPKAQLIASGNAKLNAALVVDMLSISGNGVENGLASPQGNLAYGPNQVRTAYGVSALAASGAKPLDGTGQTIAIVDAYDDPAIFQSLDTFDMQFGLTATGSSLYQQYGPASTFLTVLNQNGQPTSLPSTDPSGPGGGNWEVEEALDVEWAHAIAPGAKIILVEASSQSLADLMTGVATAASQPGVSVVSMSWGFHEGLDVIQSDEAAYDSYFTTPGVTFVASTGDFGTADPEYPAFSPNVLAVGGASLQLSADDSYQSETGWGYYSTGDGAFIGSGGGISQFESEPTYQAHVQTTGYRTTPDVSFLADPATGAWIADDYNLSADSSFQIVGGTSLSAPSWAGLAALVNQGRAMAGEAILNAASPTEVQQALYALPQSDYHVIASGFNGYDAAPGYNLVTGLGTPVANLLIADLVAWSGPGTQYSGPTVAHIGSAGLVDHLAASNDPGNHENTFAVLPGEVSDNAERMEQQVERPALASDAGSAHQSIRSGLAFETHFALSTTSLQPARLAFQDALALSPAMASAHLIQPILIQIGNALPALSAQTAPEQGLKNVGVSFMEGYHAGRFEQAIGWLPADRVNLDSPLPAGQLPQLLDEWAEDRWLPADSEELRWLGSEIAGQATGLDALFVNSGRNEIGSLACSQSEAAESWTGADACLALAATLALSLNKADMFEREMNRKKREVDG